MSKNKNMYGVICKSIHKDRNRRDGGDYPSTKFPIRLGVVNFLFFQIFICLAALMITPNVWAALTSMSVDASGDFIFRGGSDRLLITFTVDDRTDEDGDPYTVTANIGTGDVHKVLDSLLKELCRQTRRFASSGTEVLTVSSFRTEHIPLKLFSTGNRMTDEGEVPGDLVKTAEKQL